MAQPHLLNADSCVMRINHFKLCNLQNYQRCRSFRSGLPSTDCRIGLSASEGLPHGFNLPATHDQIGSASTVFLFHLATMNRFLLKTTRRAAVLTTALILAGCSSIGSQPATKELNVMTSGGFTAAYDELRPQFEKQSGYVVKTAYGASTGGASDSIPSRLKRGESADIVILARSALDALVKDGKVIPGSQVDLVKSSIGVVVRQGAPRPDIGTVDAFRRALLDAPSIAYSASASGTYYETELMKKLGVENELKPKSRRIVSERVGTVVARGDAAIGMQQVSELLPIPGVDFVGKIPQELQQVTVFSAGIAVSSKNPDAARELVKFLISDAAVPAIVKSGLEPHRAR